MLLLRRGYIDYNTWLAAMLDWRKLQESEDWNALVEDAFERFQTEQMSAAQANKLIDGSIAEVGQKLH